MHTDLKELLFIFICSLPQDLQVQLEEEARVQEELREERTLLERRCTLLVTEGEEGRASLEAVERSRKALETELQETSEKYNELDNQVHTMRIMKNTPKFKYHLTYFVYIF